MKWVKAGTLADMRMAAATMTLAELHTSDFRNLEATWAGPCDCKGLFLLSKFKTMNAHRKSTPAGRLNLTTR